MNDYAENEIKNNLFVCVYQNAGYRKMSFP